MTNEQRRIVLRLGLGLLLFVAALSLRASLSPVFAFLLYLLPYLVIGGDVLWNAGRNILHGQVFDENFLMCVATIGAFCLQDYNEACFVMLFFQVGDLFESIAVGKSRQSIASLMDIRPDSATIEQDGQLFELDPDDVPVGAVIVVKVGERVPLDGTVLEGCSELDTAALTGESLPRSVGVGDEVLSGTVNLSGLLKLKVTKPFAQSTVSRILELVENAVEKKAKTEQFITRFARYYTPAVVGAAVLLVLIPPLFFSQAWSVWIQRGLIFLVVSCPCALVISIPLSFFGGIGGASRRGILVKGGTDLEALARTQTIVFDKTGTLTTGTFSVVDIHPTTGSAEDLLELAALAEGYSTHPLAVSLRQSYAKPLDLSRLGEVHEVAGHGVSALVDGRQVLAGNAKLMGEIPPVSTTGTLIHVSADGFYLGYLVLSDTPKLDAKQTIATLKALGIKRVLMLTGDQEQVAKEMAIQLGIDEYHAQLLPQDKVALVEQCMSQKIKNENVVFVGDGINDAPVLARADLGIAMGAFGSDAAMEAADVVLMEDQLSTLADAIQIARKTMSIVRQNIVFALGVKGFVLLLAAFGFASMWLAVFADVGVSVLAILNSMRALYGKH